MMKILCAALFFLICLAGSGQSPARIGAQSAEPTDMPRSSADALIQEANRLRTGSGLKALTVNSILMGTAQWTAEYMAANQYTGHIGNVRGRVMDAGYGGGEAAWATENIMTGNLSAAEVWASAWADDLHRIPAANPIYCDIGAGVAQSSDGTVYYVLHAAYSSSRACGPYIGPGGTTLPGQPTSTPVVLGDERMVPVQTVTPQPDGSMVHVVQPGQSLWSIAIAYGLKINDILRVNNLAESQTTIYAEQKLILPLTAAPPTVVPGPLEPTRTPTQRSTPSPVVESRNATRQTDVRLDITGSAQESATAGAITNPAAAGIPGQGLLTAIGILFAGGILLIGIGLLARKKK